MKKLFYLIICLHAFLTGAYSQATLEERLKNHVYTLAADSLMGRKAGSEFAKKAADYIAAQWEEIGITPLTGESYFMPFMSDKYCNLAGIIESDDPLLKDEYIIVGAHYDHIGIKTKNGITSIYNGADDNASGVATVIELGRNLKAIQPSLRRSVILIAFDAEELGLYGSNDFSENPPVPLENIKLMMSIDMVGWYKVSGYVKYYGTGTIKNGNRLLHDELLMPDNLHVKTQNFERSLLTGTDTHGFAGKGLPTLYVTTGLKSPYHKPEDMADLIDYNGMALITEHLTNVVASLSQDDSFKASGKIASKQNLDKKFVLGVTANFGSNYHHYTAGAMDGKSAIAAGIGLNGQLNMKFLAIRPEVYYEYVGARHPAGDIATHGITVPFNLVLQTPSSAMVGFDIFAGPYYHYKFAGTQGDARIDFENMYNRAETGLNFGLDIKLAYINFGFTQRTAFTNFTQTKNADGAHIRNRASYVSLGFTF
ncbi:MAG: M28 family peptidase [Clostridiales bacterium]|nr:M28 family peptidase [Clostridiales bacterium]